MRLDRWAVPLAVALAACSSPPPPTLADGEIWGYDRPSVANAEAGMSITWRCEGTHVAEATHACVAAGPDGVVIEEREKWPQAWIVIALRYSRDGKLLAAWRGRAGATGVPLRIVPPPTDRQFRAMAEAHGGSLDEAVAATKTVDAIENVETPAGRFECDVRRIDTTFLSVAMNIAAWTARTPLPLSQLVKYEISGAGSDPRRQELAAYSWTGAVATLAPPLPSPHAQ